MTVVACCRELLAVHVQHVEGIGGRELMSSKFKGKMDVHVTIGFIIYRGSLYERQKESAWPTTTDDGDRGKPGWRGSPQKPNVRSRWFRHSVLERKINGTMLTSPCKSTWQLAALP